MSDDVTAAVVVDRGGSSGRGRTTVLQLGWRREDPLAVSVLLIAQPDHPALPRGRWVVLRDFLRYGMEEPTGDGDVRIRPDHRRGCVWFELLRGARPCAVSMSRQRLEEFLSATERIVPAGEERSDLAIEALIERLLRT